MIYFIIIGKHGMETAMHYKWYKKETALLKEIKETQVREDQIAFWYLGQMGILFKWKDLTVLIDPVLNDLTYPGGETRRNYPAPFLPSELDFADYCFCSHNHADHMNIRTLLPLAEANPGLKILVPAPEIPGLTAQGIKEHQLLAAREYTEIPLAEQVTLYPVASSHEAYFTDEKGDQKNLGCVIDFGGIHIYHSGDTVLTSKLIRDVSAHQYIDIACIPINGVDFERHARGVVGNMDFKDAAYFLDQIHADMAIPMHYDMVMKNEENPLYFASLMQEKYPGRKYHILQLGERFIYMK